MPADTRITHLIVRLGTGGAEKSLYRLLRHTRDEFEHQVICFGPPTAIGKDIQALGIPVHWLNERRYGPWVLAQARRILRADPPHILQGWMYYGNLLASLLARRNLTRIAWNIRQAPVELKREKWSTRWAMQCARAGFFAPDLVIYNSHAGQKSHAGLGYNNYPHVVIGNGIDLHAYAPNGEVRARVRKRYALGETPWVAMVCRFHPLKGTAEYLAAVRHLLDAGCDARFALAGTGMQDNNVELMQLMHQHRLSPEDVALLGEIEAPHEFLPALDVLVQASWREGTPNILLEAMACGVYTVATRVGDSAIIVRDEARLFEAGDVEAMAAAIVRGLSDDSAQQRVREEREFLSAHYETQICMQAYREHYAQLMQVSA